MSNQILIVDDDLALCQLIKKCLSKINITVDIENDGQRGLIQLKRNTRNYDLVILDVMLPSKDGFEVLSEIRQYSHVPVLMLTAKGSETDKIIGLERGADDYLSKPFSINELIARVNSLIRRYTSFNQEAVPKKLKFKGMRIDKKSRIVKTGDKSIKLTSKEFDLLVFLADNQGEIFTKRQIYRHVWGNDYAFDENNIMSFISKLRKKIEPNSVRPFYILTVHGIGYRFNQEA